MGDEFQLLNWQETKKLVAEMQKSERNSRLIAYISLGIAILALLISLITYVSDNSWQRKSIKLLEEQNQILKGE